MRDSASGDGHGEDEVEDEVARSTIEKNSNRIDGSSTSHAGETGALLLSDDVVHVENVGERGDSGGERGDEGYGLHSSQMYDGNPPA